MSAQVVKKNKMSVRGNVAYIFDGLVIFRLENKGGGFIQIEKAVVATSAEEVTITKQFVDSLVWDDTDVSYIPQQTFMKIKNELFRFCNK